MREEGPRRLADFRRYASANEAAKERGGATEPLVTSEVDGSRSRLIANEEEEKLRRSPVANEKDGTRSHFIVNEVDHKRRGATELHGLRE